MDIGYVLRRAWEITWRHKALWLFGFLVSLGTVGTRLSVSAIRWEQPARELLVEVHRDIAGFLSINYFVAVAAILVLLGLIIIGFGLALLNALGRAALVDQVRAAEDLGRVGLRAGWQASRRHLWPVFLIRLLLGLPMAVVTLAGALPVVGIWFLIAVQGRSETVVPDAFAVPLATLTCLFPTIGLATLLFIPLNVLQRLAVRACMLEELDVRQSILRAWAMLREHLRALALVWLILLVVGIGVMIVFGLPLVLVAVAFMAFALMTVLVSPLLFIVLVLTIGLLTWLAGAALNGVVETFFSASWTLAYRELTGLGLTGEETALDV